MHPRKHFTLCCLLLVTSGCQWFNRNKTPADQPIQTTTTNQPTDPNVFDRRTQTRTVEFTVHRISAPRGSFSDNTKLWELVSGTLPNTETSLRLQENGFRVAIGRESHRDPMMTLIKAVPDLRIAVDHAQPDASMMVNLEIGPCAPRVAVFYVDNKASLRGLDFVDAVARFKLTFEMRSARLDEFWLRVIPELEEPPSPPTWKMTPEGPREVAEEHRYTFEGLACDAMIPDGGFMLVGPAKLVYDRPVVARPFLCEKITNGAVTTERESIIIISPILRVHGQPAMNPPASPGTTVPQ